jgi:hypothetical protein
MDVVIKICVKYPGVPTRMRVTDVFWLYYIENMIQSQGGMSIFFAPP